MLTCTFLALSGCLLHPREYQDRPVVGVKWTRGGLVYVLGPKPGEKDEIIRIAEEGNEAVADIKFPQSKP